MTAGKRLRAPALLLALAALLVFAATASAETRAGESDEVFTEFTPTPEATLVEATASYENSGNVTFDVTTGVAPNPGGKGEIFAALITSSSCVPATSAEVFFEELFIEAPPPFVLIQSKTGIAGAVGVSGSLFAAEPVVATKSVSGTETTLSGTSSEIANGSFNCAIIAASDGEELRVNEGEGLGSSFIGIPLVRQVAPPPPPPSAPSSSGSQAPSAPAAATSAAPAAPVLSIGKPKPVTLKTGKWQTVKVKVTNTGAGASTAGSLRLKGPNGVVARPERQQLPALRPGHSFTLTFRVQLTAKAKKKSIVSLTASAPGTSATALLVLKLKQ
jgi:hypothetical protein